MPVDDVLLIPLSKYTALVTMESCAGEAPGRSKFQWRLSRRPGRDTKVRRPRVGGRGETVTKFHIP